MFEEFDYPRPMILIGITPAAKDATGAFVAGSETRTAINGHKKDVTLRDLNFDKTGILDLGDCILSTSAPLKNGDRIEITEKDGSVSLWLVKTKIADLPLLEREGITRAQWQLKRQKTV